MEVKFLANVKFMCSKQVNIKVYLVYSGLKEHCYRMVAVTAATVLFISLLLHTQ